MALTEPVPSASTSQEFGKPAPSVKHLEPAMWVKGDRAYWQPFPGAEHRDHFHPGIDRAAPKGDPVVAMESGKVIFAGFKDNINGRQIDIEIRPNVRYSVNHLEKVLVDPEAEVVRGQQIAEVGKSGSATGFHGHIGVSIKETTNGVPRTFLFNPTLFLEGGAMANDPRIQPLTKQFVPGSGRARIAGPGCNIRTSPDLDTSSNVYAISGADGFTRRRSDGAVLWKNASTYQFLGWQATDDGDFARVRTGHGQTLYIHRFVVTIIK